MQVKDVMTETPTCCSKDSKLQDVAQKMAQENCGAIPVVESEGSHKLAGMITDRDIVIRAVAEGNNPLDMTAGDCMTKATVTTTPDASVEDCCNLMEQNQIRRIPVIDENGGCCGIVSQADIAMKTSEQATGELVGAISR